MLRYILRGVSFYRGVNSAVLLAVAVATAVIAGALIVGDSVRSSLRDMSMQRLGGITHAVHSPRFVTQKLARRLNTVALDADEQSICAPALLLTASAEIQREDSSSRRAGSVILLAVDEAGWSLLDAGDASAPQDRGVVLGARTAAELQVDAGDSVTFWVELPSSIPRDSLLGEREELVREVELTVQAVLEESDGASRFSLNPSQQLPYNAFMSLATLQERLALDEVVASPRNPVARPGRVNTLLVGHPHSEAAVAEAQEELTAGSVAATDQAMQESLTNSLTSVLTLEDLGLRIRTIAERGYLTAESDSMILEDSVAESIVASVERLGLVAQRVQVYLANEIWAADRTDPDERFSMYSIVGSVESVSSSALGPFRLQDGEEAPELSGDDILLSNWLAEDLQVAPGDVVRMCWHEVGSDGDLPELTADFTVKGVLAPDDPASVDADLTPFVDGVTNVDSFDDWDQPFEMEMNRITGRDDGYWASYRATPKAFLSTEKAKELWSSRFGTSTSIRIAAENGPLPADRLTEISERLAREIPSRLEPMELGLAIQPVRLIGLQAAVGANDFSVLFLAFSSFLIMAAILLASLMFQLGLERRIVQVGVIEAVGLSRWKTRAIFLGEGLFVSILGALVGAAGGVLFARLMIFALTTWWVGAVGTRFLQLDIQPVSLAIAAGATILLSAIVILFVLLRLTRRSPRELLTGGSDDQTLSGQRKLWSRLRAFSGICAAACAIGLPVASLSGWIPSSEAFSGFSWQIAAFFTSGCAALYAGLALLGSTLRRRTGDTISEQHAGGLLKLAIANAARNPGRSLLTTSLIAFATFVIVAVAAARRNPTQEDPNRDSGDGGFVLVAESAQPILFDINSQDGRSRLGLNRSDATQLPAGVEVYGFEMRRGEDASCLNLYQATVPTLLGASSDFIERGGFRFADTRGDNPWTLLNEDMEPTGMLPTIPVIGDLNTLQYNLKKGMGDVILFPDDDQPEFALQVVGQLDSSIFQGVLVLSDSNLKRIAPEVSGDQWFLIETATPADSDATSTALETAMRVYGFDTESVSQQLAGFLAVQNTYLSTFQMLGALGLLVGTFGLSAVMIRNILERRAEIALMQAVGFAGSRIMFLIVFENSLLLLWGMVTGTAAALLAILPHLLSSGAAVSWPLLGITLGVVAAFGSIAVIAPVLTASRTSIRSGLTSI